MGSYRYMCYFTIIQMKERTSYIRFQPILLKLTWEAEFDEIRKVDETGQTNMTHFFSMSLGSS